jgi:hypothetical protein
MRRSGPVLWTCFFRFEKTTTLAFQKPKPCSDRSLHANGVTQFVEVPSSAGGNSSFELHSQSMGERATLDRYHHFHGHSGMCAWLALRFSLRCLAFLLYLLVFQFRPFGACLKKTTVPVYASPVLQLVTKVPKPIIKLICRFFLLLCYELWPNDVCGMWNVVLFWTPRGRTGFSALGFGMLLTYWWENDVSFFLEL